MEQSGAQPNAVTRTESGQFPKGVSGNPAGRPKGRRNEIVALKQEMELAVRTHADPHKVKKVVEKVLNKAMNGNIPAAKLIFDHFLSKATDAEDEGDKSQAIIFRIENATFGAPKQEAQPVDVKFEEVPK